MMIEIKRISSTILITIRPTAYNDKDNDISNDKDNSNGNDICNIVSSLV